MRSANPSRERIIAYVALATPIAWQLYAVIAALRHAPAFMSLYAGYGGPLPAVTRYLAASYPYWFVVPALFTGLSMDVLRRHDSPVSYFTFVLVASVIAALGLHAWLYEGFFAPVFAILQKIG